MAHPVAFSFLRQGEVELSERVTITHLEEDIRPSNRSPSSESLVTVLPFCTKLEATSASQTVFMIMSNNLPKPRAVSNATVDTILHLFHPDSSQRCPSPRWTSADCRPSRQEHLMTRSELLGSL